MIFFVKNPIVGVVFFSLFNILLQILFIMN